MLRKVPVVKKPPKKGNEVVSVLGPKNPDNFKNGKQDEASYVYNSYVSLKLGMKR